MKDIKVSSVVDVCRQNAENLAKVHGAKAYYSLEDMLKRERPDMVDICAPSYLHCQTAVKCMEAKLDTLCEKPISNNLADAEKMLKVQKQNGVRLMIAQVIRFTPEYLYLKKIYDKKTYGNLKSVHFTRMCQAPKWGSGWYTDPETSGMAPFELHVHDADFVYYMLGRPKAVKSNGYEQSEFYNSFLDTQYIYENEAIIRAEAGWYGGPLPFSAEYRAVFDRAVIDYSNKILTVYPCDGEKLEPELEVVNIGTDINLRNAGGIYNEILYFANCIRENKLVEVVTPEESIEVLDMLLKELESSRTKSLIAL
jgi:predicted dehydrogenase